MFRRLVAVCAIALTISGCAGTGATSSPTGSPAGGTPPASASSGASPAATIDTSPLVFAFSSSPDIGYLPVLMALDDLKSQGYAITQTQLAGNLALQGLVQNSVQFANIGGLSSAADAIKQGATVRAYSTRVANEAVWVTQPQYADCSTLTDKPVGIFAQVSSYTSQMKLYFAKHCPDVKPTYLVISDSATRAQALASGQIVATVLGLPDALALTKKDPSSYDTVSLSQELPGVGDVYLWTNEATLSQHGEAVQAIITAQLKAVRSLYADSSQLASLCTKYDVSCEFADQYVSGKMWYANGGLFQDGVNASVTAYGYTLAFDQIADDGPMNAVLQAIGRSDATEH